MSGADFVFNVAKGRVRTYYDNVDNNTPANSALVVVLLETSGLEADSTLKDYDNLLALLGGTSNEPTGGNYTRKTVTDAELTTSSQDDTNDRLDLDIPDQTWTTLTTTGNASIGKLLICYDDDTTSGTDTNIIPLTAHSFDVTPDGSDVIAQIAAAGFFRAS